MILVLGIPPRDVPYMFYNQARSPEVPPEVDARLSWRHNNLCMSFSCLPLPYDCPDFVLIFCLETSVHHSPDSLLRQVHSYGDKRIWCGIQDIFDHIIEFFTAPAVFMGCDAFGVPYPNIFAPSDDSPIRPMQQLGYFMACLFAFFDVIP